MTLNNERDKQDLLARTDAYREVINAARPLTRGELDQIMNYYRVGLTYESNAIEGNTLTIDETKILLEDGLTVGGKPIKDYYEATGHAEAYDFMLGLANAQELTITEDDILELHRLFYHRIDEKNAGSYRSEQVFISGTAFMPPPPGEVPGQMAAFVKWANEIKPSLHPVEWAALMHLWFVNIHPFVDGNGRTARLLLNLALINAGYGVAIIPNVLRADYMRFIRAAQSEDAPNSTPFVCLIAECVLETQKDYCRMLRIELPDVKQKKPPSRDGR